MRGYKQPSRYLKRQLYFFEGVIGYCAVVPAQRAIDPPKVAFRALRDDLLIQWVDVNDVIRMQTSQSDI